MVLGAASTAALLALLAALPASCGLSNSGLPSPSSSSSAAHSSSGSGQGGDLLTSSNSAASGMGGASSSTSGSGSGAGGAGGALSAVWQSWDAQTDLGNPTRMFVPDTNNGNPAALVLYRSIALDDLGVDMYLSSFKVGPHPDGSNNLQHYWVLDQASQYPYVGKSTVGRGMPPVFDLQLYPWVSSKVLVAAFECPFDGNYTISGIAARRVFGAPGDDVQLRVFVSSMPMPMPVANVPTATKNQNWVMGPKTIDLKMRTAKTHIIFAVDCLGDCANDGIQIAWTITAN